VRNYIELLFMHWTDSGGNHYYAFGNDEEQLAYYVELKEQYGLDHGALGPFIRTYPKRIYWLLDGNNFGRVLNGSMDLTAFFFYLGTNLADLEGNGGFVSQLALDFRDMTAIKGVEPSPRNTWSHGH